VNQFYRRQRGGGSGQHILQLFGSGTPVLVPGFQRSDCSNSGIHLRCVTMVFKSQASQGLSTGVLHLWWKSPPPPKIRSQWSDISNKRLVRLVLGFFLKYHQSVQRTRSKKRPKTRPDRSKQSYRVQTDAKYSVCCRPLAPTANQYLARYWFAVRAGKIGSQVR